MRAGQLRELHATGSDPARGAEYENLLARLDLAAGDHHPVGRAVGDRQRRRRCVGHVVGQADQLRGLHPDLLGETAVHRLAEELAELAIDRIDHHAVAHVPARHLGAKRGDLAGDVDAHDQGHAELDAGHAAQREQVVIVERAGLDPQHHVGRAGHGIGPVHLEADVVDIAVAANDLRLHGYCDLG